MARVPQDTGDERLIPEAEVLGGLGDAGAEILASEQLGLVPDFTPPRLLAAAAGVEGIAERIRWCAACAPTTWSSLQRAPPRRLPTRIVELADGDFRTQAVA